MMARWRWVAVTGSSEMIDAGQVSTAEQPSISNKEDCSEDICKRLSVYVHNQATPDLSIYQVRG